MMTAAIHAGCAGGCGSREEIRGDFLEEVMLKLRPEGRAGGRQARPEGRHMPGRLLWWGQQGKCTGPQLGGPANSSADSKQSV